MDSPLSALGEQASRGGHRTLAEKAPIREAVRRLDAAGSSHNVPHRGARVNSATTSAARRVSLRPEKAAQGLHAHLSRTANELATAMGADPLFF